MKRTSITLLLIFLIVFVADSIPAKTFLYSGNMTSTVEVDWERTFTANGTHFFEVEFAKPVSYRSGFNNQIIDDYDIRFSVPPTEQTIRTDEFGNQFVVAKWERPPNGKIRCNLTYTAELQARLSTKDLTTPFPPTNIPEDIQIYLNSSGYVQSDNDEIQAKARSLAAGAETQAEAVANILSWVADNVIYVFNFPERDAVSCFRTKVGNCENYAHLACALLRSVGIPARVVGGITVHQPWVVPVGRRGRLTQVNGQGRHAWIEVYYPDVGWAQFDPQQSHYFVGTRFIRNGCGLDVSAVSEKMKGSPRAPREFEDIQIGFTEDDNAFSYEGSLNFPGNYIVSSDIQIPDDTQRGESIFDKGMKLFYADAEAQEDGYQVPDWHERIPPPEAVGDGLWEIGFGHGKIDDIYQETGSDYLYKRNVGGQQTFLYVTESGTNRDAQIYAQAFYLDKPMDVESVYLLMHNFGGTSGKVWVELRKDENGKPAFSGLRSKEMSFSRIGRDKLKESEYIHGYTWFDFSYRKTGMQPPTLSPGKWWIVVRHDGNAIVNWKCIWGNPYGDPDDAKSTRRMTSNWNNTVNVDFNFKVRGKFQ